MATEFPDRCLDSYDSIYRPNFLSGKYAFITGGGSGINFRISESLMRHGCNIAIVSRSIDRVRHAANELNTKIGSKNNTRCIYYSTDVTDYSQVESTVKLVLKEYPRIDILVNGAAGNFLCRASDLSTNAFNKVLQIDTVGTFNASKAVSSLSMAKPKKGSIKTRNFSENGTEYSRESYNGGVIINVTATLDYTGTPLQIHSSAAKAAIDAMTRVLCNEWGRYNIRVNGIAPGPIEDTTGMDKLGGFMPKNLQKLGMQRMPLGRYGTKKEIADGVLYLVSDAATYVTGEILVVDGGTWFGSNNDIGTVVMNNPKWLQFITDMKTNRKKSKL